MRARLALYLALVSAAPLPLLGGCSSDDNGTGPGSALVATWNATSFSALGQNFIALGMTLRITFASGGTYSINIAGDLIGACDQGTSCVNTGSYSATATQVTLDPGTADAVTFNYTIQGQTLTLTGSIDGNQATITLTRA